MQLGDCSLRFLKEKKVLKKESHLTVSKAEVTISSSLCDWSSITMTPLSNMRSLNSKRESKNTNLTWKPTAKDLVKETYEKFSPCFLAFVATDNNATVTGEASPGRIARPGLAWPRVSVLMPTWPLGPQFPSCQQDTFQVSPSLISQCKCTALKWVLISY